MADEIRLLDGSAQAIVAGRVEDGPIAEPVRIRPGVQCHCPLADSIVFLACEVGSLDIRLVGGSSIRLRAGDACLMPSSSQYCVEAERGSSGAEMMLSVGDLMAHHVEVVSCSPALAQLIGTVDDVRPLLFRRFYTASAIGLVEGIFDEFQRRDVLFRESMECAVRQLVIMLARAASTASRAGGEPLTVRTVVAYLEANLETATVASVARHFAYHPNTVSALIRRETGKTFCELVTELRMNRAKELVVGSSIPVQRIAEACGYRNVTHFYNLFRRVFGCTPGECRAALAA